MIFLIPFEQRLQFFPFTSCFNNLKGILHNLKLCPTQFISNLYHNKDHKKDYMFKTCLMNLTTWISELKCNFKRYMTPLHLAKMHTKPKQFTLEIKSDLLNSRFCLDNSTIVQWILKNVVNIVHLGTVRYHQWAQRLIWFFFHS